MPVVLEFRDGPRNVPEYLAPILKRQETYRLTYDEAMKLANRALEADFLNGHADRIIAGAFRDR